MDVSSWDHAKRQKAWDFLPRVFAARTLFEARHSGKLGAEDLYQLVLWVTGSEDQADEAASLRAESRMTAGVDP